MTCRLSMFLVLRFYVAPSTPQEFPPLFFTQSEDGAIPTLQLWNQCFTKTCQLGRRNEKFVP